MPKKTTKKREPSWDKIGEMIGRKMEKEFKKKECKTWGPWTITKENGGGFGRFLFIVGVLYSLSLLGYLEAIPLWVSILIVIGFTAMKF